MARRKGRARAKANSGEWGTYAVGVLTGALVIGGLYFASTRGAALDWPLVLGAVAGCALVGFVLLKWPKSTWATAPRRTLETLGFMLMGPVIIALALGLFYTVLPSDFAPRTDFV